MLSSLRNSPSENLENHSTLRLNNSSSCETLEKMEHNVLKTKKENKRVQTPQTTY